MKVEEWLMPTESDIENEQVVLCGMIRFQSQIPKILEAVNEDDFTAVNRDIFTAVVKVWQFGKCQGSSLDTELVLAEVMRSQQTALVSESKCRETIVDVVSIDPSGSMATTTAEVVRERSVKKQVVRAMQDVSQLAMHPGASAEEVVSAAQSSVMAIGVSRIKAEVHTFKTIVGEIGKEIDMASKTDRRSVSTGLVDLDSATGGFFGGELCILAARPSVGKSALALTVACNASLQTNVLMFSLEMSRRELVGRVMCANAGVPSQFIRSSGRMGQNQVAKLIEAGSRISELPIWVSDTASMKIRHMRAIAQRIKSAHGLGLIVVDYLQLIDAENPRQNRVEQVGEMSRSMKLLAREMEVPVLCLAQLNRAVETRGGKPKLSDLRESGSIENDADTVMFLHRETAEIPGAAVQPIELIIAKQRNGPCKTINLGFRKDRVCFENYATNQSVASVINTEGL